ncbi:MAG: hypothetical protein JXB07_10440 [Anaerolineae bacterium]|nr:hypothetical protein [Anaerolineae bacterium]
MRHLTCEPNVEIRGEVLLSLLQNIRASEIEKYVEKYGLTDVKAKHWYRIQPFLDLLNELASIENRTPNFVAIGITIAETAYMPPEMSQMPFGELLMHWDDHYQNNHRLGDIGYKSTEKINDRHYQVTLHGGLYPDDFEYGVLYGFGKRFLKDAPFVVSYDDTVQRLDKGGKKTVLDIQWE